MILKKPVVIAGIVVLVAATIVPLVEGRGTGAVPERLSQASPGQDQLVLVTGGALFEQDVHIGTIAVDGTGVRRLTGAAGLSFGPVCSGDGRRIVFASRDQADAPTQIYVMARDGTERTRLTSSPQHAWRPLFSPDGRRILFSSFGDTSQIHTMGADGADQLQIAHLPGVSFAPTWSPDGRRVAFFAGRREKLPQESVRRYFESALSDIDLYVMNSDGTERLRLVMGSDQLQLSQAAALLAGPAWSPDGRRIGFWGGVRGQNTGIYVVSADGGSPMRLAEGDFHSWSPDGQQIAFSREDAQLYVMRQDGSGQTRLTSPQTEQLNWLPAWSPDGRRIAFVARERGVNRPYALRLYIINTDGSGRRRLAELYESGRAAIVIGLIELWPVFGWCPP